MNQARDLARLSVTHLVHWAVIVDVAFDLFAAGRRVSKEALLTCAKCFVVLGRAAGIATAKSTRTSIDAFVLSDRIDNALLIVIAVSVCIADNLLNANVVLAELELRAGFI